MEQAGFHLREPAQITGHASKTNQLHRSTYYNTSLYNYLVTKNRYCMDQSITFIGTGAPIESAVFVATSAAPRLVYVLENDRISCVITELIVKKDLAGGEVRCYTNGQQALEALALAVGTAIGVPDLILLDLDMPLVDGWEFLEALGGLPLARDVCVFVLTSSIHPDDLARVTGYPAVKGFFTKPLDYDNIVRMQVLLQERKRQVVHAALAPVSAALAAAVGGNGSQLPVFGDQNAAALE